MSGFVLEVENDKMKKFKNVYCLALGLSFSEKDKVKMISILDNLYQHDNSGETEETGPTSSSQFKSNCGEGTPIQDHYEREK